MHRWSTRPRPEGGAIEVLLEGACVAIATEEELAPLLEGSCLGLATRHMDDRVVLHAAGLEIEGRGLALVGEKGSGKSTLALRAAELGHRFLGDELLPIAIDGALAYAFPKSVTLKRGSFSLFREQAEHADPLRGPVRYLLPRSHAAPGSPAGLHALVFPSFSPEAGPPAPTRLQPEEVALALVQQTFGGLERVAGSLGCIAALCQRPCYFLPFADPDAAVRALEAIAAELPA